MHANSREDIKEAFAGDIVALAGLEATTTGDTLCAPSDLVVLEQIEFPEPVIDITVEPKTAADAEKMALALARLAAEDPSFAVSVDPESGQTVIRGMGELHLEIIVDRLKREFKVEASVGAPQVAYRESISKSAEIDTTHQRQIGALGQFARVRLRVTPGPAGSGFRFEAPAVVLPKEFVAAIERGVRSALGSGVLAGFPLVDFSVTLVDGAFNDVDSSPLAFEIAAATALKGAVAKAGPKLLEPIMRVEVLTPDAFLGDVIGDLNARRGQVAAMDSRGNARTVSAMVPLANMFGYVNALRSMSQGRAQYTMHFDHMADVPVNLSEEIRARMAG
jgi:elongation factor G